MESFWGSMQIELLNRQRWRTNLQLAVAMADYIENFYNTARRHSALNYLTPINTSLHSTPSTRPHCPREWSTGWGQPHEEARSSPLALSCTSAL